MLKMWRQIDLYFHHRHRFCACDSWFFFFIELAGVGMPYLLLYIFFILVLNYLIEVLLLTWVLISYNILDMTALFKFLVGKFFLLLKLWYLKRIITYLLLWLWNCFFFVFFLQAFDKTFYFFSFKNLAYFFLKFTHDLVIVLLNNFFLLFIIKNLSKEI